MIKDQPLTATPSPKTAVPNGGKDPIDVRVLRFVMPMDACGLNVASACTAGKKHAIQYLPWMRHFRIEWTREPGLVEVSMVHETHAKSWEPA